VTPGQNQRQHVQLKVFVAVRQHAGAALGGAEPEAMSRTFPSELPCFPECLNHGWTLAKAKLEQKQNIQSRRMRETERGTYARRIGLAAPDRGPRECHRPVQWFGGSTGVQELEACPRRHAVVRDAVWYNVYCFAKPEQAEAFRQRFDGEPFDPKKRNRGGRWHVWEKT